MLQWFEIMDIAHTELKFDFSTLSHETVVKQSDAFYLKHTGVIEYVFCSI